MGNDSGIKNCDSEVFDEKDGKFCLSCKSGYGIGGECKNNMCKSCIKCGLNCNTCRKCICTSCSSGHINPKDPSNCIEGQEEEAYPGITDYSDFQCNGSMINLNFILILIIILLFKIKCH